MTDTTTGWARTTDRADAPRLRVAVHIETELLRLGVEAMLPRLGSVAESASYTDPAALREALADGRFQILVLSGAPGTAPDPAALRRAGVRTLVLLDSADVPADVPVDGPGAGPSLVPAADGYLLREDLTARALDRALCQLAAGEMPMPLHLGRRLLSHAQAVRLTAREKEVLTHLVAGLSNKQIARGLRISEHGVKRLVSSVLLKLGAANRTAAVVTAIKLGLIE
ncbi:LuxR C-terminal-related transcriptional regulator [Streptomyces sp. NPDC048172]|uniref:LuxR C-terminal-related transcriptional regulator n=1 Tax=Streptomyces sp. NPDC048172 TaxID=3365505 RepID=UPI00371C202B